jgi:hypothetical protein
MNDAHYVSNVSYSVSIFDSFGEEKFKSIKEFKFSSFQNSIVGIQIQLDFRNETKINQEIKISLRLGTAASNNDLSIFLNDTQSKEKVIAIKEGLLRVMDYNKTNNWVYFYNTSLQALVFLIVGFGMLVYQDNTGARCSVFWIIYFTVIAFLALNVSLKKYSAFDTKKQGRIDKWLNWFFLGLLSFVLFSTIFPIFRKSVFEF